MLRHAGCLNVLVVGPDGSRALGTRRVPTEPGVHAAAVGSTGGDLKAAPPAAQARTTPTWGAARCSQQQRQVAAHLAELAELEERGRDPWRWRWGNVSPYSGAAAWGAVPTLSFLPVIM